MSSAPSRMPGDGTRLLYEYRLDPFDGDATLGLGQPTKPWKKVALALGLLLIGTIFLCTGVGLFVTGRDNGIPLMVIGSFAFIPGAYYTRLAYKAWRGFRGYNLASIPDL